MVTEEIFPDEQKWIKGNKNVRRCGVNTMVLKVVIMCILCFPLQRKVKAERTQ